MFRSLALWTLAALACSAQCVLTLQPNLPTGALGAAYPGTVVHGGAGPWSYALTSGALPNGLSLTPNGGAAVFTGTASAAGTFDFTLRVTDSNACTGSAPLRIVIGGDLTVQPSLLSNATTGRFYSQTLGLSAGSVPLTVTGASLLAGTLPPGLSLTNSGGNWSLAGTPNAVGNYDFTLQVTGGTGFAASRRYVITVTANTAVVANPDNIRLSTRLGEQPLPPQRLTISAADGGAYRYRVVTSSPSFRLDGAAGEYTTPFTLTLDIQSIAGTPGQFLGYVDIIAVDGLAPTTRVPVELIVQSPPSILVSTSSIAVSMRQNEPPVTRNIQISSTDLKLAYTIETLTPIGGNWLTLTPVLGETPASLTAVFNPVGLNPGTYAGTIRVNATRNGVPAVGSPQLIAVSLSVDTPVPTAGFSVSPLALAYSGQVNGPLPPAQPIRVNNATGSVTWSSSGNTPWISLSQITGTTPTDVMVTVIPNGLAAGTHTGSFTITSGNSTVTVPVTLTLSAVPQSGDPILRVTPDNLVATVTTQSPTAVWNINVDAIGKNYDVQFNPTVPWLTASPGSGTTPAAFNILADASKLETGTHKGAVVVVTTNQNGLKTSYPVNVTLYLNSTGTPSNPGSLIPSRSTLFFDWRQGAGVPAPQTLILNTSGIPSNWDATSTVTWINLSKIAGTTPSELEVSVSPQFLGAGNYRGEIRFRRGSEEVAIVTVLLSIGGPGAIRANPSALVFLVETGRDVAPQLFDISRFDSDVSADYSIRSTPDWLTITPASGKTPARLEAQIRRDRLPQATTTVVRLEGEVAIESAAGGARVPVLVTIVPPQGSPSGKDAPWILSVTNAASTQPGPVAPCEHVTLYGGFAGRDTRVWFDNNPGTILSKDDNQITVAAPFALAGRASTRVRVDVDSLVSRELELRVVDTAPGIYTANGSGRGLPKGVEEPVEAASFVTIRMTGLGQTDPPGQDGARVAEGETWKPLAPVEVKVGGLIAEVTGCQTPAGEVHGAMACQFRVPPGIEPGEYPLLATVGGIATQPGVILRVK